MSFFRARSRALRAIAPETVSECSSFWESRADFPEVSLQLLDASAWELVVYGGFFREENIIILQARSILCAVRCAWSKYPLGRLLILSDKLALVLALCRGRSLLSFMRRICASGFWAGFVLSFRWIPSESKYSDNGSRFFDRDFDPNKSLLQAPVQHLSSFPMHRRMTKDVLFRHGCSWTMVKSIATLISACLLRISSRTHVLPICRVQRVCFQIHMDYGARNTMVTIIQQLSHLNVLPVVWEIFCIRGLWKQMCALSSAPVTWCGFRPGLYGSPGLDGAPTRCASDEDGYTGLSRMEFRDDR